MVWSNLQKVVEKALHYSTPLGTIWLFLLFTFRMFIFSVVGGSVYGDESVSCPPSLGIGKAFRFSRKIFGESRENSRNGTKNYFASVFFLRKQIRKKR